MKAIIGLGNPGKEYEDTRHNIGFQTLDKLADKMGVNFVNSKFKGYVATGMFGKTKFILLKPLTFMNLSGEAVGALASFYKLKPEDIMVIYDDLDLDQGRMRIRAKGSSGGHNGIKSLINHLGTDQFPRVKIGIGRPYPGRDVPSYVLSKPDQEEKNLIETAQNNAITAMEIWLEHGLLKAMNEYNFK